MKFLSLTAGFVLPAVLASAAQAQLVNHKDLSLATALAIATTASETCKAQGNRVTVAVIGRIGEVRRVQCPCPGTAARGGAPR